MKFVGVKIQDGGHGIIIIIIIYYYAEAALNTE